MLSVLFPSRADNTICGCRLPFYLLILTATITLVRSCIHIFSPDGGAGSIAGMDLAVSLWSGRMAMGAKKDLTGFLGSFGAA